MTVQKNFLRLVALILLGAVCFSAASAEDVFADGVKNLEAHGLSLEEVTAGYHLSVGERSGFSIALSWDQDGNPLFTLFDVTGDGCVDLCRNRMFGSGMVRIDLDVYDPVSRKGYVLDGYNYDFRIKGVSGNRLRIVREGPNGYGDPVTKIEGTLLFAANRLLFAVESEPAKPEPDMSQAAVPFDQAVLYAADYVKERPEIKYFNEVRYSPATGGTGPAWSVIFLFCNQETCAVLVDGATGEIEQFSLPENDS